jgi:hypothetical protein
MNLKFIIIFILISNLLKGQALDNIFYQHNTRNIYFQALSNGLYNGLKIPKTKGKVTSDTLYLLADSAITNTLIDQLGKFRLIVINTEQIKNELKSKPNIMIYKIYPLRIDSGKYSISFAAFMVRPEESDFSFAELNGGFTVYFNIKRRRYNFINAVCFGPD